MESVARVAIVLLLVADLFLFTVDLLFEKLPVLVPIFALLRDVIGEVDPMRAALDPGGLGHGRVYLLEVELALDALLVDVWNHIRRLDKRHREGQSNLEFGLGENAILTFELERLGRKFGA